MLPSIEGMGAKLVKGCEQVTFCQDVRLTDFRPNDVVPFSGKKNNLRRHNTRHNDIRHNDTQNKGLINDSQYK